MRLGIWKSAIPICLYVADAAAQMNWTQLAYHPGTGTYNEPDTNYFGVAWAGNQAVAVGSWGTIINSRDGIVWSTQNSGTRNLLSGICWSGEMFVAVGYELIMTSPDGINWTNRSCCGEFSAAASSGSDLVAVGSHVRVSKDGIGWTDARGPTSLKSVVWAGTKFVGVSDGGAVASSVNGGSWVWTFPIDGNSYHGIAWNGSTLAAVGSNSKREVIVASSEGGGPWTNAVFPPATPGMNSITWTGTHFAVAGRSAGIFVSPDAKNWIRQSITGTSIFYGIVSTGNRLIAVGLKGAIAYSDSLPARPPDPVSIMRRDSKTLWGADYRTGYGRLGSWLYQFRGSQAGQPEYSISGRSIPVVRP